MTPRSAIPLLLCLALLCAPARAADNPLPFREDSGLSKAEYLLTAGKYTAALDTLEDVLARHPQNADAYTYRGLAYYQLGEAAQAVKNFRTALSLDPAHLGANKYLGDLYLETGDIARALEQLQVIRMTCGQTDCAEQRALESAIDRHRQGGAGGKKD